MSTVDYDFGDKTVASISVVRSLATRAEAVAHSASPLKQMSFVTSGSGMRSPPICSARRRALSGPNSVSISRLDCSIATPDSAACGGIVSMSGNSKADDVDCGVHVTPEASTSSGALATAEV